MKRLTLCAAFLAISTLAFAASTWEGSAVAAGNADFPMDGLYGACNSFPLNSTVEVENLETGKKLSITITRNMDNPAIFMALAPKAAAELGMKSGASARVRVLAPLAVSTPAPQAKQKAVESSDPDFNPRLLASIKASKGGDAGIDPGLLATLLENPKESPSGKASPETPAATPASSKPEAAAAPETAAKPEAAAKPDTTAKSAAVPPVEAVAKPETASADTRIPAPGPSESPEVTVPAPAVPTALVPESPDLASRDKGLPSSTPVANPDLALPAVAQAAPVAAPVAPPIETAKTAAAQVPESPDLMSGTAAPGAAASKGISLPLPAVAKEVVAVPESPEVLGNGRKPEAATPLPALASAETPAMPETLELVAQPATPASARGQLAEPSVGVLAMDNTPPDLAVETMASPGKTAAFPDLGLPEIAVSGEAGTEAPETNALEMPSFAPSAPFALDLAGPDLPGTETSLPETPSLSEAGASSPAPAGTSPELALPGVEFEPSELPETEIARVAAPEPEKPDIALADSILEPESGAPAKPEVVVTLEATAPRPPAATAPEVPAPSAEKPAASAAEAAKPATVAEAAPAAAPTTAAATTAEPAAAATPPAREPAAAAPAAAPAVAIAPPAGPAIAGKGMPAREPTDLARLDTKMRKGDYFIQLGLFATEEALRTAIATASKSFPLAYESVAGAAGTAPRYRLFVGPLSRDESGLVLQRVRMFGYKDAVVKAVK